MELEKIKEIFVENFNVDINEISENSRFAKDLGLDSLDIFQFFTEIEGVFDVEFPDGVTEKIKTVGELAAFIKGLP